MKPIFQVIKAIGQDFDEEGQEYSYVAGVTPALLKLECPYCRVYSNFNLDCITTRDNQRFDLICSCHSCGESIFAQTQYTEVDQASDGAPSDGSATVLAIYPQASRLPDPAIPEPYATDYREAALVIDSSPRASAALSRRVLQTLIRQVYKITHDSLDKEIREFVEHDDIPSDLAQSIDAIRVVGNHAAHPSKSSSPGEMFDVEPGEAELLLDVLDELFDIAFIRPKKRQEKLDTINAKLAAAGKPTLKSGKT